MSQQASNHDVLLVFDAGATVSYQLKRAVFQLSKTDFSKGVILSANFAFISKGTSSPKMCPEPKEAPRSNQLQSSPKVIQSLMVSAEGTQHT
jgi:hypothetical protein